jgi:hypothetical protein
VRRIKSLRAFASIAVGLFVAFTSHQVISLAALGIFTLLYGLRTLYAAPKYLPIALIALVTSFLSITNLSSETNFILLATIWGVAQAAMDFINRDLISAGLALALAILFALAPLDVVSAIGFFGAYLMLSGVHLGIAAYSPKK